MVIATQTVIVAIVDVTQRQQREMRTCDIRIEYIESSWDRSAEEFVITIQSWIRGTDRLIDGIEDWKLYDVNQSGNLVRELKVNRSTWYLVVARQVASEIKKNMFLSTSVRVYVSREDLRLFTISCIRKRFWSYATSGVSSECDDLWKQ